MHAGKAAAPAAGAGAPMGPGMLVVAVKADKQALALVTEPDGKKNWFVVDQV